MKRHIESITRNLFFKDLGEKQIETLLFYLKPKIQEYPKNTYVELDAARIYILLKGYVHIISYDGLGAKALLGQYSSGDFFMEMYSHNHTQPEGAITAVKKSVVMLVNYKDILRLQAGKSALFSVIIRNMFSVLSGKTIRLYRQLKHVSKRTIRQKLMSYFLSQTAAAGKNEFIMPVSKSDLADWLFINRSSMTRELAAMKKEKLIDFQRRKVIILQKK